MNAELFFTTYNNRHNLTLPKQTVLSLTLPVSSFACETQPKEMLFLTTGTKISEAYRLGDTF